MSTLQLKKLALILCSTLSMGIASVSVIAQDFRAAFLIDRSGSMTRQTNRAGVIGTRCTDALKAAEDRVKSLAPPGSQVSVWTFTGSNYVNRTGGFVSKATALLEIAALQNEPCSGQTPLAHTICEAIDTLEAEIQPFYKRQLWVLTDGLDNPGKGLRCSGPADADLVSPWDPISWQGQIWQQLFPLDTPPLEFRNAPQPVTPIYWGVFGSYINKFKQINKYEDLAGDYAAKSMSMSSVANDGINFASAMSAASGGYVTVIDDNTPIPAASRLDVNGDGCVNQFDLIKMIEYLDQPLSQAPASLDVNYDAVVNITDYNLVVENFGLGC